MARLFDLCAPAAQATPMPEKSTGITDVKITQFESAHTAKVATIKKHIPHPPGKGEVIFIWTTAQFNTMSMIIWLIENLGPVDELIVSSYSISQICVQTLLKWMDAGKIASTYLYLSDYTPRMAAKKYEYLLQAQSARPGKLKIGLGFNHSKITLAAIGEHRIVITGSGNFAENGGNEQYTMCDNEQIYDFFKTCITEDHPVRYRNGRPD